jgi:hypothetical protein
MRRQRTAVLVAEPDYFPVYFVAKDLHTPRHRLTRGTLWPEQTKSAIRQWASTFGEDERAEWHTFRFVETVLAPPAEAEAIVAKGMTIDEARQYLAALLLEDA